MSNWYIRDDTIREIATESLVILGELRTSRIKALKKRPLKRLIMGFKRLKTEAEQNNYINSRCRILLLRRDIEKLAKKYLTSCHLNQNEYVILDTNDVADLKFLKDFIKEHQTEHNTATDKDIVLNDLMLRAISDPYNFVNFYEIPIQYAHFSNKGMSITSESIYFQKYKDAQRYCYIVSHMLPEQTRYQKTNKEIDIQIGVDEANYWQSKGIYTVCFWSIACPISHSS